MRTDVKPNQYFMIKLRCARCGVERTPNETPEDFKDRHCHDIQWYDEASNVWK